MWFVYEKVIFLFFYFAHARVPWKLNELEDTAAKVIQMSSRWSSTQVWHSAFFAKPWWSRSQSTFTLLSRILRTRRSTGAQKITNRRGVGRDTIKTEKKRWKEEGRYRKEQYRPRRIVAAAVVEVRLDVVGAKSRGDL